MTTITTVGYGDICPENDLERLYAIASMVIGGAFYGFLIGNITAIVTSVDAATRARDTKMEDLHGALQSARAPCAGSGGSRVPHPTTTRSVHDGAPLPGRPAHGGSPLLPAIL